MSKYRVYVASDDELDDVFVEVIYEGEIIAEVTRQNNEKMLTLFAPENGTETKHVAQELIAALSEAEKAL